MAQYLSADLRIRVIGAVEAGMSRNAAARRFVPSMRESTLVRTSLGASGAASRTFS